jgi:hypothetical protein
LPHTKRSGPPVKQVSPSPMPPKRRQEHKGRSYIFLIEIP